MDFVTPSGFRDVMPDEAEAREAITDRVQAAFAARGYRRVETPTVERMDVMDAAGRVPGTPFKLFDNAGDLLALRPDVTMQVARICSTRLRGKTGPWRFRYTQRVFRQAEDQVSQRELTQIGVEAIGTEAADDDAQLVCLFGEALKLCGLKGFTIALGSVAVLRDLLQASDAPGSWKNDVLAAYHSSNFVELDALAAADDAPKGYAEAIAALPRIRGGRDAIDAARDLVRPLGASVGLDALAATFDTLTAEGPADALLVDFSIMSSFDYYTGIVFEAYAPGLGSSLGGGGRYDGMLEAFGTDPQPAAGFAFYLEQVMAALSLAASDDSIADAAARPLRIAVPKGSLAGDTLACLRDAGLDTTGLDDPGRTLIIRNPGVDYIIVRPTDAPIFVALGAADCGICGKDSLVEADPDVVELVDLAFGGCRFVVAEPAGATPSVEKRYSELGSIRIASKYPRITRTYCDRVGIQADIVKLHGNIELAPLTGMAERIVDITATGTTLRENNLTIVDEVMGSTARFFANPCAFRMDTRVVELATALAENVKE